MKRLKKIILLFSFCSGILMSCPDKTLHNGVEKYMKTSSGLEKHGDKLILDSEKFVMGVYLAVKGDENKLEDAMASVLTKIMIYSKNHNYKLTVRDGNGNEKEIMEFIKNK